MSDLPVLTDMQLKGVKDIGAWYKSYNGDQPDYRLAGFAGTGKSTMLPTIVDFLGIGVDQISFCAPTGKAAKVMSSKLKDFGIETRCRTIHSLIYTPKQARAEMLEKRLTALKGQRDNIMAENPDSFLELDRYKEIETQIKLVDRELDRAYDDVEGPKFMLNPESDLMKSKLCIVDEGSMVGETIADDLRQFGVPVFVMGDPGQLQPVGDRPGFDLADPNYFLSEVHRQALDSPIIRLATIAREGKPLPMGDHGDGVRVIYRKDDDVTTNPDVAAQVLVGTNLKRWNVTKAIRKALGHKSTGPCNGEPLLVCKNSRAVPDLVNGSFLYCTEDAGDLEKGTPFLSIQTEDENGVKRRVVAAQGLFEEHLLRQKGAATASKSDAFRARIEREHIDWGWAITVHKSQGSQWDEVVLHDESGVFREEARNWLYTGTTRAAKRLTVVV